MYPQELKYTKSHEWVSEENNIAKIGITTYAIKELTDITYLEYTVEEGEEISSGDSFAEIESVKTTSEIYSPVSGKILAIHAELPDELDSLTENPYQNGWMLEIELSDASELESLMTASQYTETLE